jgi:isocitrate dehydrogenase
MSGSTAGRNLWHVPKVGLRAAWAQALAEQSDDADLKQRFAKLAAALSSNESKIVDELKAASGKPTDIGGYYRPVLEKVSKAMRPSATFNAAIAAL